ncbi:replication initiation protein [Acinetobacter towneri]|uniref:Replication initiation protein n=1 Tax=Acinetobacter towneri TaxID=202956 RepID=A0AB35M5P3_9GAMM|nr:MULTISPECIES: replication initiation protein RepM [Acinetobacter]MDM1720028.1 replication initiation protein [Acinetobacter towneri]MDM1732113.1 replication initiation protein [Acinetobacter towneri]MDM1734829.1 replication initiation protein [Acinetobacter towneri]MDM1740096.1 replication initiation protein [Acinetobacter towneri]MDM1742762.1 replication initiation protein [Acinetobacter towneri]
MKHNIVVKDNALINASYNLDLAEQRLILLAIVEARQSGKGINANDPLVVHADNYANQFNVHKNTAYATLKSACHALFLRQFSYQQGSADNIEYVKSRWVSEIRYIENEGIVKLIFAPAVVPLITRLEKHFTKYELEQISNLSSAYAIRLYELLVSWRSTGETPFYELNDFRKILGVKETDYPIISDLKKRVLDISIKQLNEHTDIIVQYEQHKKGRSISGFSFTFKQKKVMKTPASSDEVSTKNAFSKMTDAQRHLFSNKLSELPEMSKYSQGTESYQQFAIRIAEMLQNPEKFKELYPYLQKVGFKAA